MTLEIIAGLFLAGTLIIFVRRSKKNEVQFWSSALIIAAIVYVAFAGFARSWEWLPTEILGVLIYGIPAALALRYSSWWLVLGWLAHVGWDVGFHAGGHPGFVPHWYPGVCIGFDWAVAGYWVMKIIMDKR